VASAACCDGTSATDPTHRCQPSSDEVWAWLVLLHGRSTYPVAKPDPPLRGGRGSRGNSAPELVPLQGGGLWGCRCSNTDRVRAVLGFDEASRAATHRHPQRTGVGSRRRHQEESASGWLPTPGRRTPTPRTAGSFPLVRTVRSTMISRENQETGSRSSSWYSSWSAHPARRRRIVLVHQACADGCGWIVSSS
jgi:hypothetical protein